MAMASSTVALIAEDADGGSDRMPRQSRSENASAMTAFRRCNNEEALALIGDCVGHVALRLTAPYLELWDDALEVIKGLGKSACRIKLDSLAFLNCGRFTIVNRRTRDEAVIIKDYRALMVPAATACVAACSSCASLPSLVVFSGFSISSQLVFGGLAVLFAHHGCDLLCHAGANGRDRHVTGRIGATLMLSSAFYFTLSILGGHLPGLPELLASRVSNPEVFVHHVIDLVVNPILIRSYAYVRGNATGTNTLLSPKVVVSQTAMVCLLGATMNLDAFYQKIVCLGGGALLMAAHGVVAHAKRTSLDVLWSSVTPEDLMTNVWSCYPVIQALELQGYIDPSNEMVLFGILDCVTKYIASAPLLSSGHMLQEPDSEPEVESLETESDDDSCLAGLPSMYELHRRSWVLQTMRIPLGRRQL